MKKKLRNFGISLILTSRSLWTKWESLVMLDVFCVGMIVDAPFQIYHLIGGITFLLSANLRNPSCLQRFQDVKLENPHPRNRFAAWNRVFGWIHASWYDTTLMEKSGEPPGMYKTTWCRIFSISSKHLQNVNVRYMAVIHHQESFLA